MDWLGYAATALVAYLLGSIPTGFLVAKFKGVDIRTVGSGNIGATNAFRVLGKAAGSFVLLADAVKGYAAARLISIGVSPGTEESHSIVAGIGAILGHNFTCWLKFKGGKGIATSAGVLFAWCPLALVIVLTLWTLVFWSSGYVSLGSLAAAFALPFSVWLTAGSRTMIGITAFVGAMAIYKHKTNIQRLLNGTESRFGKKKTTP